MRTFSTLLALLLCAQAAQACDEFECFAQIAVLMEKEKVLGLGKSSGDGEHMLSGALEKNKPQMHMEVGSSTSVTVELLMHDAGQIDYIWITDGASKVLMAANKEEIGTGPARHTFTLADHHPKPGNKIIAWQYGEVQGLWRSFAMPIAEGHFAEL